MEQFEDAIVAIDSNHNITLFNEGAQRIFGFAPNEVLGEHLNLLLPERFHLQHDLMIEEFGASGKTSKGVGQRTRQIFGRRKDGSEFAASVFLVRTGAGTFNAGYAAVIRDISENKKTEDELLRLAATDPLTGAFNRREFTSLADQESQRANRYNRPLSIMMLDLDHFKKLNDTYGHAAGDKALQKFTTLCCNTLRTVDVFGRWGGEEFVAILHDTTPEGAKIMLERLRATGFGKRPDGAPMTASIGVAERLADHAQDWPQLIELADHRMYEAKRGGRDRAVLPDGINLVFGDKPIF